MKDVDHVWGAAPTVDEVRAVTNALLALYKTLNNARRNGFIAVVGRRAIEIQTDQDDRN